MKLYRGTQYPGRKGLQKTTSWTPSLPVAVIYSAVPGDPWASNRERSKAHFLDTSTVHSAELKDGAKVLDLCGGGNYCSLYHTMEKLDFGKPDGLTHGEGEKILIGLHNRYMREVTMSGGPFKYAVYENDDLEDRYDEDDVPFDIRRPQTLISWIVLENWEYDPKDTGRAFLIDAFALADSPTFRNVARRLGYEGVKYEDVFAGGEYAAPKLLGCDVEELEGVEEEYDLEGDEVPMHETFRPLNKDVLTDFEKTPTEEVLPEVACEAPAANPRKLKAKLLR